MQVKEEMVLSDKMCEGCYYYNVCCVDDVCSDYTPVTEHAETEMIEDLIESRRAEYRRAWFEYIEEFN